MSTRKKKTSTKDLLKQISELPKLKKTYTLTVEQFDSLKEVANEIMSVRRLLEELRGEEEINCIMFDVGLSFNAISWCESELDGIVGDLDDEDELDWK